MPKYANIQSYFSKLNPLAERISRDINDIKTAYGHLWVTLSITEQESILNDTMINPDISLQYYTKELSLKSEDNTNFEANTQKLLNQNRSSGYVYDGQNLQSFIHQQTSLKFLHDDIGEYCDEFSSPFNFRTKSQMNLARNIPLTMMDQEASATFLSEANTNIKFVQYPTKLRDIESTTTTCEVFQNIIVEKPDLLSQISLTNDAVLKLSSEFISAKEDNESKNISEKTKLLPVGFDFLSNW